MEQRQSKISLAGSSGKARLVVPQPGEPPLVLDLQIDDTGSEWMPPLMLDLDLDGRDTPTGEMLILDLALDPGDQETRDTLELEFAFADGPAEDAPLALELTLSIE